MICKAYYQITSVVTHLTDAIKDLCNHATELSHHVTQKDNHLFMRTDSLKEFTSLQSLEQLMVYHIRLFLNHFNSPPFLTEHHIKQTYNIYTIYSNVTIHINFTWGHVAIAHKQIRTLFFCIITQQVVVISYRSFRTTYWSHFCGFLTHEEGADRLSQNVNRK